jgi:hypothetical protein
MQQKCDNDWHSLLSSVNEEQISVLRRVMVWQTNDPIVSYSLKGHSLCWLDYTIGGLFYKSRPSSLIFVLNPSERDCVPF